MIERKILVLCWLGQRNIEFPDGQRFTVVELKDYLVVNVYFAWQFVSCFDPNKSAMASPFIARNLSTFAFAIFQLSLVLVSSARAGKDRQHESVSAMAKYIAVTSLSVNSTGETLVRLVRILLFLFLNSIPWLT